MTIFKPEKTELKMPMNPQNETLGSKIAELRKKHSLTQEEFAERLGVTPQAVSKWENDVSCPDIMLLPKIAEMFGVSIDELMGVKTSEKKKEQNDELEFKSDIGKLKLRINIYDNKDHKEKPIKVSVPIVFVMRAASLGIKISSLMGNDSLNNVPFDKIIEFVKSGVTGEVFDLTADDGTKINIEIS